VTPFSFFVDQVATLGPAYLFVLAVLETSFVTGLVVPSGVATSVATIIAVEGQVDVAPIVVAALVGGFTGDTIGFWIGRLWGNRVLTTESRWTRLFGVRRDEVEGLFGRHPVYSVTIARLISFVRTVMPMAAGMSGMTYRRFLPYEIVGLVGWLTIYLTIGFASWEGWEAATRWIGLGGAVAFVGATAVALFVARRRAPRRRKDS
jgi:membrane-associated protein